MNNLAMFLNMAPCWRLFALLGVAALTPLAGHATTQYATSFTPGSYTTNNYAWCQDPWGYAIPGAQLTMAINYVPNTNVHFHANTPGHPTSSISPDHGGAGSNGLLQFSLTTSTIGQDEYITVHCVGSTQPDRQVYFSVGYTDIYFNNHPEIWVNVGGNTTNHSDEYANHWMLTTAAYGIYNATQDYLLLWPDTQKIASNDQGLPYGGVFDIKQNWIPPHQYHQRGTAADMRNNMGPYSVPVSRTDYLIRTCWDRGAELAWVENDDPADSDSGVWDPNRHIHCHWPFIP